MSDCLSTKTIAIVSRKGGGSKSMLSMNLALTEGDSSISYTDSQLAVPIGAIAPFNPRSPHLVPNGCDRLKPLGAKL